MQAEDAAGTQLAKLYADAERQGKPCQRHGAVARIFVDLLAPSGAAAAMRLALDEVRALAEQYEEAAFSLRGADVLVRKFAAHAQTAAFMGEHGLVSIRWMGAPELKLRFAGERDAVEAAKAALAALKSGSKPEQLKVACPDWFWQAVRSKAHWPAVDALRKKLAACGVQAKYESLVPRREPGVLASLCGQSDAIAAANIEVHGFMRNLRATFVAEPLPPPLDTPTVLAFLAKDKQRMLREAVADSGCGFELISAAAPAAVAAAAAAGGGVPQAAAPRIVLSATISAPGVSDLELSVALGDMLRAGCDAVVNPANSRLNHGAGAARAIWQHAGGAVFDAECQRAMRAAGIGADGVAAGRALRTGSCGLLASRQHALCKRKQQRTFFLALLLEMPGIAKNLVRLRPLLLDERAEDEAPQSQWRLPSGDERVEVSQDRFCRVRLPSPLFNWVGSAVHNASRSGTLSDVGLQQIVAFGNFADADLRRATTSAAQVRGGARAASSSTQAGART